MACVIQRFIPWALPVCGHADLVGTRCATEGSAAAIDATRASRRDDLLGTHEGTFEAREGSDPGLALPSVVVTLTGDGDDVVDGPASDPLHATCPVWAFDVAVVLDRTRPRKRRTA